MSSVNRPKVDKKVDKKGMNLISLSEAAKLCCYSQEYLSLRARQGKLKSVKTGRNWMTTPEWLKEYLDHYNELKKKEFVAPKYEKNIEKSAKPEINKNFWVLLLYGAKNRLSPYVRTLNAAIAMVFGPFRSVIDNFGANLYSISRYFLYLLEFINVSIKEEQFKLKIKPIITGILVMCLIFGFFVTIANQDVRAGIGIKTLSSIKGLFRISENIRENISANTRIAGNFFVANLNKPVQYATNKIISIAVKVKSPAELFGGIYQKTENLLAKANELLPEAAGRLGIFTIETASNAKNIPSKLADNFKRESGEKFKTISEGMDLLSNQFKFRTTTATNNFNNEVLAKLSGVTYNNGKKFLPASKNYRQTFKMRFLERVMGR